MSSLSGNNLRLAPSLTGVLGRIADDPGGDFVMKNCWMLVLLWVMRIGCILALLCSTNPALALSGVTEKATVHAMRNVPCMAQAIDSDECIEYELRTGKVSYIIYPRRAILLEVGGDVVIRLAGNELMLRPSGAAKEIRCDVIAMMLRSEQEKKEQELEWERDRKRERESQPSRYYPRGCYTESGIEISCGEQEAHR